MITTDPMRGVFLSEQYDLSKDYRAAIVEAARGALEIVRPSEVEEPDRVEFAVCWQPGPNAFAPYPNLRFAMAVGAGVDALLAHPGLPEHVQVCRARDPLQGQQMAGYALHEILHVERRFGWMACNAKARIWAEPPLRSPAQVKVAVLGGGSMGRAVAQAAAVLGFSVRVASRGAPDAPLPGVSHHYGLDGIITAVDGADFLVNVLPLTPQTRDILDLTLFKRMAPNAWLVQIGRGEQLVEADLLTAIDAGVLSGASLDVARVEPLPLSHPFWTHPALRITPHAASAASVRCVAEQLLQCALEVRSGERLSLAVNRVAGY